MNPNQQIQDQINQLRKDMDALNSAFYRNNFYGSQDFNKTSRFNTTLKVPHYASAPSSNEVGQLIEVAGVLYISTAVDTFTKVGAQ